MRCLKCGNNIESPAVFCERCAADMEQHPVSRETPLILHVRPVTIPKKKKATKPEEIIARLQKQKKRLLFVCAGLTIACALLAGSLIYLLSRPSSEHKLGQNYNTTQQTTQAGGVNP